MASLSAPPWGLRATTKMGNRTDKGILCSFKNACLIRGCPKVIHVQVSAHHSYPAVFRACVTSERCPRYQWCL